ncbi:AraC family transcriptional regulator [Siphonobacter sp. SORGH_AS_1065]|uniref:helix-turn-helix domain-containing protein n=1 Tax=Siphonobacter sp. SORGH_AS_1065 TaxID=3041795 RepID=UPI002786D14D|nr:helix-turn-helix transcriptional regulator [Siphonobacter sp. SORGH_AS_1065]MDQ1089175.1 AraC family transcriptional activator of pobA [Siphonobacter sp. SORGH_AS_1065]
MKKDESPVRNVKSIAELHRLLNLPKPQHPLISVIHLDQIEEFPRLNHERMIYPFYQICMKRNYDGKLRYGQNYYDFDEGVLSFISPNQLLSNEGAATDGWVLIIHPDFLHGYPLARAIRKYGFFSYELTEALFVSDKEQQVIDNLLSTIKSEYQSNIDAHSQDIIITQLELLLHYADRFYQRQFITRKKVTNDLLTKLESILEAHFNNGNALNEGLPSVEFVASQLNVSPHYLSDMLRNATGMNAQQHIQYKLIEKAKEILSTTNHSVAEIAYQLGFKHPQSFNKLFKSKTHLSPLQFRQSFN